MKMLNLPIVMALMSLLVITHSTTTPRARTTGSPGRNLNGKMFTLSPNRGGISFFPPNYSPSPSRGPSSYPNYYTGRPYIIAPSTTTTPHPRTTTFPPKTTTRRPKTTTRRPRTMTRPPYTKTTPHPYTTVAPARGVSVCLRYLTDNGPRNGPPTIFTLSPSSQVYLRLYNRDSGMYTLAFGRSMSNSLYFSPDIQFWSNLRPEAWTRVCVTVDTVKKVAQMFKGPNMSIRKILPFEYVWSGQPEIDFSGFDGQVTDVQVWDYPLRNGEVFDYMTRSVYEPYSGSVLTWSSISYSPRGDALLEDAYEWQSEQPIRRRGRRPKGEQKSREVLDWGEKREQL